MMPPEDPYNNHGQDNMSGKTRSIASSVAMANRGDQNVHVHDVDQDQESGADDEGDRDRIRIDRQPDDVEINMRLAPGRGARSGILLNQPLRRVTLKFEDVGYKIKLNSETAWWSLSKERNPVEKTILHGITGIVCPGEILAMLGPSGSGKTTLLSAMGGRLGGKVSGSILFNSRRLGKSMKRRTGFVTQDDVLYPHLTVRETLIYAGLLRLPKHLSKQDKTEYADAIIVELGLTRCRNTIIGGPLLRGVSGGERKRVSIGHEMLTNPSLLFLDEPTSGLDSTTAQKIIFTLQSLARGGRTIVTTIHQPSSRLYYMFNKVILLTEGNAIYYGEASAAMDYFSSIGFSPAVPMNPADFMLDLANGIAPDARPVYMNIEQTELQSRMEVESQKNVRQSLIAEYKRSLYGKLKAAVNANDNCAMEEKQRGLPAGKEDYWTTSWWQQYLVLLKRSLKERRHESFGGLRVFQVLTVSILAGLLWWQSTTSQLQDQVGLLFFFSIFWGFFPLFNAIFTFPQENSMLIKERSSGMYRLSSYFVARTAGDLPMELILPIIFVIIAYWMGGLKPDATSFILTLLVILYNVLVSQGLGLAMGAALMEVKQATTLASVTMLTFLLAGGYYIQKIPAFIAWLKYISFSYYCYKLLLAVQYKEDETYDCGGGRICRVAEYPSIKTLGLGIHAIDLAALGIMLVGYRLLAYAALRRVKLPSSTVD